MKRHESDDKTDKAMNQDTPPPGSSHESEPASLSDAELVAELSRMRRRLAHVTLGPAGTARHAELAARYAALTEEHAKRAASA